jgi:DNA-binding transcriptional MerR regulator
MDEDALGLATPEVVALCGVPASTLKTWVEKGLCEPSLIGPTGRRATQYWTVRDVVTVRTIKTLRRAGCSLATLQKVATTLRTDWNTSVAEAVLWWDGRDVLTLTAAGDVISLIRSNGQGLIAGTVVQNVTCPVSLWERQVAEAIKDREPIRVSEIRSRHATRLSRRNTQAEASSYA